MNSESEHNFSLPQNQIKEANHLSYPQASIKQGINQEKGDSNPVTSELKLQQMPLNDLQNISKQNVQNKLRENGQNQSSSKLAEQVFNPQQEERHILDNICHYEINPNIEILQRNECDFCAEIMGAQLFEKIFKCSHIFCKNCLSLYIENELKNFRIPVCPTENCKKGLNQQSNYYKAMTDVQKQKYDIIQFRNKIQISGNMQLCPDQKCKKGYMLISKEVKTAQCKVCKVQYCLNCKIKSHSGKCQGFQEMLLKDKYKYKQCYGCKRIVERNQGCPHMTCKCGAQFCYFCGRQWSVPHRCVRYIAGGDLITDRLERSLSCLRNESYQFNYSLKGFICKIPYYIICFLLLTIYFSWCLVILSLLISCLLIGTFFVGYIALLCKLCKDGNQCGRILFTLFIILLPVGYLIGWIAIFCYSLYQCIPKFLELVLSGKMFPCNLLI